MAKEPIKVGILGLGRSGWGIHANAFADHPDYQVVAVADPVEERRKEAEERFGCRSYEQPQGVIADADVEVVIVATPSHTHVSLTEAALASGKHVVVEKPLAESPEDVDRMIEAGKKAGRVVTCYQPRRFDADFLALQELIDSGKLGQIVMIRRAAHSFGRRADWQMLRKFGGGELTNTGPHFIDQIVVLLGEGDIDLFADLQHTVGAGDAEDHVKLVMKHENGVTADIEITRCSPFAMKPWQVIGTLGGVEGNNRELKVKRLDPATLPELEVDEGPAAGRKYGTGEELQWIEETLNPAQTRGQSLLFYDALAKTIRDGAPVYVTLESVRPQIELIERARKQTGFL